MQSRSLQGPKTPAGGAVDAKSAPGAAKTGGGPAQADAASPAIAPSPGTDGHSTFQSGSADGARATGLFQRATTGLRTLKDKATAHVDGRLKSLREERRSAGSRLRYAREALERPPQRQSDYLAKQTDPQRFKGSGPDLPSLVYARFYGFGAASEPLDPKELADWVTRSPLGKDPATAPRVDAVVEAFARLNTAQQGITQQEQTDAARTFALMIEGAEAERSSAMRGYSMERSRYEGRNSNALYRSHQAELKANALRERARVVAASPTVTEEERTAATTAAREQLHAALDSLRTFLAANLSQLWFPGGVVPDDGLDAWRAEAQKHVDDLVAELQKLDTEIGRLEF